MKTKKYGGKYYKAFEFIVVLALILGLVNPGLANAKAGAIPSIMGDNLEETSLDVIEPEIAQGESVHVMMSMNGSPDPFSLQLSLYEPDSLLAVNWTVIVPPVHGYTEIFGDGYQVELSYNPDENYTGDDFFTVLVEDEAGNSDQIAVFVSVFGPELVEEGIEEPLGAEQRQAPYPAYLSAGLPSRESRGISTVNGGYWLPETLITLTIDDPATGSNPDYSVTGTSNLDGFIWFSFTSYTLKPGDLVSMTDGVSTKTTTVKQIFVSTIDQVGDKVSGTSEAGITLQAYAWDLLPGGSASSIHTFSTNPDGTWLVDFSGEFDIKKYVRGFVSYTDADGDTSEKWWEVTDPIIKAGLPDTVSAGSVNSSDWWPGSSVNLSIDDPSNGAGIDFTDTQVADSAWEVVFNLGSFGINPDLQITVTDGDFTEYLTVANIVIGNIDTTNDVITGTAEANRKIEVNACNGSVCGTRTTTSDGSGSWSVDFSTGAGSVDLNAGTYGSVIQTDEDNDMTVLYLDITWVSPTLISPVFDAEVAGTPTYRWSAPSGSAAYIFEYDDDSDFSSPIYTSGELTTTSFKPPVQEVGTYWWHVKARDAADNWSLWSTAWRVIILPAVPASPVLIAPAANAILNDKTPTLSWNSVPYGVKYQVQISKSTSFSPLIQDTTLAPGILTLDANSLLDGTYYWRVRAYNSLNQPGAWAAYRKLTIDAVAQAVPAMVSPANGAYVLTQVPKLSVGTVTGIKFYRFQVDETDTFDVPFIDAQATVNYYTVPVAKALPFGTSYWRVQSIDAAGNESPWSTPRSFIVTILKAPANGSITTNVKPVFSWAAVSGAKQYKIQVNDSTDFSGTMHLDVTRPASTSYTPVINLPYARLYWRVQVETAAGWSNWTPAFQFTVTPTPPVAPVLVSPLAGFLTKNNTPDFAWNAAVNGVKYQIQISKSSTFGTKEQDVTLGAGVLTYTAAALPDGTHYWRVRAINSLDVPGKWATYRAIKIDTNPQAVPAPVTPAEGTTVVTTIPKFTVGTVSGLKYYHFQVDDAGDFTTPLVDVQKTVNYYTLTAPQALPFGTLYWRARSIDAAGNESAWSTPKSFVVNILKTPANNAYTTSIKPVFTWGGAAGALEYRILVDDSIGFDTPVIDVFRTPSTSFTSTVVLPYGKYYWRMQVRTAAGWSNWTGAYRFTVTPPIPVKPMLTSPAGGALVKVLPQLKWTAVVETLVGIKHYEVQVSKSSTFGTLVISDTTAALNYTPAALADGKYYWRVRAVNNLDVPGAWATYRYFTLDAVP